MCMCMCMCNLYACGSVYFCMYHLLMNILYMYVCMYVCMCMCICVSLDRLLLVDLTNLVPHHAHDMADNNKLVSEGVCVRMYVCMCM